MQDYAKPLYEEQLSSYKDGREALYVAKLMLVKMAYKDWTPIDRQWINSEAKRLRAAIGAACHFGCEGSLSADGALANAQRLAAAPAGGANADESEVSFAANLSTEVAASCANLLQAAAQSASTPSSTLPLLLLQVEAEADDRADGADGASGSTLQVVLRLDDHELRLGTLKQRTPPGCTKSSDVIEASVDVARLRRVLVAALGLQQPDKDPSQFR